MRVLLLHPEDVPWRGEWAALHWDLIVDLGFAGAGVYEQWSKRARTRVMSLHQFAGETEGYRQVKQIVAAGRGKLLDHLGLDWWEILAPYGYEDIHALYLLRRLQREFGVGPVELVASRPHSYVRLLSALMESQIRCLAQAPSNPRRFFSRISEAGKNLRPSQIVEIAFDKWDPTYRIRSRVAKYRRAQLKEPVVLLPSAYFNVTRTALAYASQLPDRRFLLATTRRSGESHHLPANVDRVPLAAYAEELGETQLEMAELIKGWSLLQTELSEVEELRHSFQARLWDYFFPHLRNGLRVRDAWRFLMSSEPVTGVLCGDDLNYYTRLPLILAKRMGRTAIYCSHGALDGGLLFKKSYADIHLVKGEMERDYMLRVSDVGPEEIEVAAPAEAADAIAGSTPRDTQTGDLVFFSQPYEVFGGRTEEIYAEILLPLVAVARQINRKIVLKLHPFESKRGRGRLLKSTLSAEDRTLIEVSNVPSAAIMSRALCGIGLDSSVAVECAQHAIPYFLCGWLDFNGLGYMQQFAKFGAGIILETPAEILSIPERLIEFEPDRPKIQQLWQPTEDVRLAEIMFGAGGVLSANKCA